MVLSHVILILLWCTLSYALYVYCNFQPRYSPFCTDTQCTVAHAGNEVLEYSLDKCKLLAEKVSSVNELPYECKKYPAAVKEANKPANITRKDTDPHAGMQGAMAAKHQKASGRESHAQIQRRLTNSRRFTKQK